MKISIKRLRESVDRNEDINQEIEGEWIGMKISIKRLRESG